MPFDGVMPDFSENPNNQDPEPPLEVVNREYDSIAQACLVNARDHWDSAAAVASKGHFGQAQALSILGMEELAKSLHYKLAALGLTTFDRSHKPRETRIGGETMRARYMITEGALHSQHEEKLVFLWTMGLISELLSGAIGAAAKRAEQGQSFEMSDEELEVMMKPSLDRILASLEEVVELNQKKKDGFYVGRAGEESSPRNVSESDYAKVHDRLGRRLEQIGPFIVGDWKAVEGLIEKFLTDTGAGKLLESMQRLDTGHD